MQEYILIIDDQCSTGLWTHLVPISEFSNDQLEILNKIDGKFINSTECSDDEAELITSMMALFHSEWASWDCYKDKTDIPFGKWEKYNVDLGKDLVGVSLKKIIRIGWLD